MVVEYRKVGVYGLNWYYTDGSFDGWARSEEEASMSLAKVLERKKSKRWDGKNH